MPGGAKGGKKSKGRRKRAPDDRRELQRKVEGTEYGKVIKNLGGLHLEVWCADGKTRKCRIPGSVKHKVWIVAGDIILVQLYGFDDGKGDVLLKYTGEEARTLQAERALPDTMTIEKDREHEGFVIGGDDDESSDDDGGAGGAAGGAGAGDDVDVDAI